MPVPRTISVVPGFSAESSSVALVVMMSTSATGATVTAMVALSERPRASVTV